MFIPSKLGKSGLFFCLCLILWGSSAEPKAAPEGGWKESGWDKEEYRSIYLEATISYRGCARPDPSEARILPYMHAHRDLFKNKTVLDIGTGTGILGLYTAKHGAAKVVATDIDQEAIECTQKNARRLRLSDVIETRYVPPGDLSAYAVIKPEETFDIIVSNPPGSLVLNYTGKQAWGAENGVLGFSIIRGLGKHLKPDGRVILFYDSFFYHEVMVKFARYMGYEVEDYTSTRLGANEADALFNNYLAEVLKTQNVPLNAFKFDLGEGPGSDFRFKRGRSPESPYSGVIVIQRKK